MLQHVDEQDRHPEGRFPPFGISWTCEEAAAGLVRFNPCGRAVDVGRRGYTTFVRPFRDSPTQVKIRWFKVPQSSGVLPFPSAILNLDHVTEKWLTKPVGEVPNLRRRTDWRRSPPRPPGGHICGTADEFKRGGFYLPDVPPVKYHPNGLPVCCSIILRAGWGGFTLGGSATYRVRHRLAGSGGFVLGGVAQVRHRHRLAGSGGFVVGGTATVRVRHRATGTGGFVVGGTADARQLHTVAGSGGFVVGGTATAVSDGYLGYGGIVFGGTADVRQIHRATGSGGFVVGGEADARQLHTVAGSGGFVVGGTATAEVWPDGYCSQYGATAFGSTATLLQTSVNNWGGSGRFLQADGVGGWTLLQNTPFTIWYATGWDGHGCKTFTNGVDPDAVVCCEG